MSSLLRQGEHQQELSRPLKVKDETLSVRGTFSIPLDFWWLDTHQVQGDCPGLPTPTVHLSLFVPRRSSLSGSVRLVSSWWGLFGDFIKSVCFSTQNSVMTEQLQGY